MKTAYLLYGFNVKDFGKGTTGKLRPFLEALGYKVIELKPGFMLRLSVRLCNKRLARFLADTAEKDSLFIGHSNGCAIGLKASQFGAKFSQMVFINPAVIRFIKFVEIVVIENFVNSFNCL